jgi:ribosomal protein L31E
VNIIKVEGVKITNYINIHIYTPINGLIVSKIKYHVYKFIDHISELKAIVLKGQDM